MVGSRSVWAWVVVMSGALLATGCRDHRLFYIGQFLSKQRTAQALAELFGIPLSPGTVAGITPCNWQARQASGARTWGRSQQAKRLILGSTRQGSGSTAGWLGCTAPASTSTPEKAIDAA